MIEKRKSLEVSETVLNKVIQRIEKNATLNQLVDGNVDVFFNGRERGLNLYLCSKTKDSLTGVARTIMIWVCEARNCDNILVIYGADSDVEWGRTHQYSERAWEKFRKQFSSDAFDASAEYIMSIIGAMFHATDSTMYNTLYAVGGE